MVFIQQRNKSDIRIKLSYVNVRLNHKSETSETTLPAKELQLISSSTSPEFR